jgi:glycosyltransferase involved in cell wall biosynthesis
MRRPPKLLFLSYNAIQGPLMKSQALPYLRGLARLGAEIHLLTFEKRTPEGNPPGKDLRAALRQEGIHWSWLRYRKRPPLLSTLFDVVCGMAFAFWRVLRKRVDIIEARGTIPAGMGYPVARLLRRRFLFNVRGLLAEEYADAGRWSRKGSVFRWVSRLEKRWMMRADAVIVLTEALKRLLASPDYLPRPRSKGVTVIPCCVDVDRFQPGSESGNPAATFPTFVYAGSLGGYYLVQEMFGFFYAALERWPDAKFLILANGYEDLAREGMYRAGLDPKRVEIESVSHEIVPRRLAAADVGLVFARPAFARVGMSPTKMAEYLACGLPVVTTSGVGDTETLVREDRIGVVVESLDKVGYERACDSLSALVAEREDLRERCRQSAVRRFGLDRGLEGYRNVLKDSDF